MSLPVWSQNESVKFTVLKTGSIDPLEATTLQGGSWFKRFPMTHPAFLIEHPKGNFLFDTGLGTKAKEQVQDMVWWARLATEFNQDVSALEQIKEKGIKLDRIILSHAHFDHSSGVADFPDLPIEVTVEEMAFAKTKDASAAIFPSLFPETVQFKTYELEAKEYEGFPKSRDIYGDGKLVLVGLPGHTPGSVGLFVNLSIEKRIFLVGDTVWNADAIEKGVPKFWFSKKFVDNKPDEVMLRIQELQALQKRSPEVLIVPSHDARSVAKAMELAK
ncbi:MBL fold metallo-hydrolase [Bdellovibrio sp. HCB117]|uniref:MBL fold metallo-hydrolase n=1 Tax=Bdellovibrio sp. HCB117 TaxID=3394359 RepID=UPI0039B66283